VLALTLPGLAAADWEAGVAAFKDGNYQEAAQHFQEVIEQQPDLFQGYLMLGHTLLKDRQAAKAVAHLQKALELNAGDVQTSILLAQALYQTRKYREVAQVLSRVDASSLPKATQATVYRMRGGAYLSTGQTDKAVADLGKAAELSPSDAKAQYDYGRAAYAAGQTKTAVQALEKAVRLDGQDPEIRKDYVEALKRMGRMAQGAEKVTAYEKAEAAAQALVSARPTYDNLLLLGEVQLGAKSYDAAVDTLTKASAQKANDWLPLFYLGQALAAKQQFVSAEQPLRKALELATAADDQKTVWRQLGFVHEKQKKYEESIAAYQRAGDSGGVARVEENKRIAEENREIEEHNQMVEELADEAKALEEELKSLPGGAPPPPRR
jgi:tetratricopeptide (TPR) repeat protein